MAGVTPGHFSWVASAEWVGYPSVADGHHARHTMRRRKIIMLLGAAGVFAGQFPAHAQIFSTYHCRDGSEFVVSFYDGDKRAHVQLDGKAIALQKRISLSGARYVRGDVTLRMTKTATTLKRGKKTTDCSAN